MSSTSLSRSRSLRKPAPSTSTSAKSQNGGPAAATNATATDGKKGSGNTHMTAPPPSRSDLRNASPSRLPVKPPSTRGSGAAGSGGMRSVSSSVATTGSTGRSLRSTVGSVLARSSTLRTKRDPASAASDAPSSTSATSTSTATTRYPPSASQTRPTTSAGIPSSSSSSGTTTKLARTASHSRTRSTVLTHLTDATTLRPSSSTTTARPRPASQHGPPRPPSRDSSVSLSRTTRPPSRDRTASGSSTRTDSSNAPMAVGAASRASSAETTGTAASRTTTVITTAKTTTTAAAAAPRLRPAFTTLQQHYSPARNLAPKPLTSTFLAGPSPSKQPANVALSAETSRAQAELLRLHLLHRGAAAAEGAWHESARRNLAQRFAELKGVEGEVAEREATVAERTNLAALRRWVSGEAGLDAPGELERERERLGEMVQALDAVVTGLWALGEPGGRYARAVRRFERWAGRMRDIEAARRAHRVDDNEGLVGGALLDADGELLFVGGIDDAWTDECAHLARKLDGWRDVLDRLGQIPPPPRHDIAEGEGGEAALSMSSLERMLRGCRELAGNMRLELDVMGGIVADAVEREDEWVARVAGQEEERRDGSDTPRAGAVWRAF